MSLNFMLFRRYHFQTSKYRCAIFKLLWCFSGNLSRIITNGFHSSTKTELCIEVSFFAVIYKNMCISVCESLKYFFKKCSYRDFVKKKRKREIPLKKLNYQDHPLFGSKKKNLEEFSFHLMTANVLAVSEVYYLGY